ncbi:MAG: hypothetical protein MUC54_08950, partial [Chloroflexi bacterium]|nr:hypothetical protein [Chloroflexota bacterium]
MTADPRALVAVDLGTSAVKVGVLDLGGRLRGFARVPCGLLLDGDPGEEPAAGIEAGPGPGAE